MDDLWTILSKTNKPIFFYGMGNGADKILDQCALRGISISGVFASDAFVRGQTFRGFRVLTYAQVKEQYGSVTVLVAFATSLPDVLSNIERIAAEQTLYIPDVPVYGEELFDLHFAIQNRTLLEKARALLSDEESRTLFDHIVYCKLTGSYPLLMQSVSDDPDGLQTVLHPIGYRLAADLGAFTGDTATRIAACAPRIETIVCMEPDPKTFKRLTQNLADQKWAECYPYAAWDCMQIQAFQSGGSRSSRLGENGKTVSVQAMPLDGLLDGRRCDFIKFDVEGADMPALRGCADTIRRDKPELLLSLYHRPSDLFALPLALNEICPGYRMYLRRARSLPAWDINLLCVWEGDPAN